LIANSRRWISQPESAKRIIRVNSVDENGAAAANESHGIFCHWRRSNRFHDVIEAVWAQFIQAASMTLWIITIDRHNFVRRQARHQI
jgi:hypothetical protein